MYFWKQCNVTAGDIQTQFVAFFFFLKLLSDLNSRFLHIQPFCFPHMHINLICSTLKKEIVKVMRRNGKNVWLVTRLVGSQLYFKWQTLFKSVKNKEKWICAMSALNLATDSNKAQLKALCDKLWSVNQEFHRDDKLCRRCADVFVHQRYYSGRYYCRPPHQSVLEQWVLFGGGLRKYGYCSAAETLAALSGHTAARLNVIIVMQQWVFFSDEEMRG